MNLFAKSDGFAWIWPKSGTKTLESFRSRKKNQLWIKYVYVVHWNGLAGVVHCTFKHEWHEWQGGLLKSNFVVHCFVFATHHHRHSHAMDDNVSVLYPTIRIHISSWIMGYNADTLLTLYIMSEEDVHISPSRTNPGTRPGCLGIPKRTMACLDWDQQLPCPVRWNQFVKVVWESESFLFAVSFPNLDDAKGPVSLRFPQAKKYIFSLHGLQRSRHSLLPRLWL